MKTLSIYAAALVISVMSLGSLKPIQATSKANRAPALEKTTERSSYKPLKSDIKAYLVSVAR